MYRQLPPTIHHYHNNHLKDESKNCDFKMNQHCQLLLSTPVNHRIHLKDASNSNFESIQPLLDYYYTNHLKDVSTTCDIKKPLPNLICSYFEYFSQSTAYITTRSGESSLTLLNKLWYTYSCIYRFAFLILLVLLLFIYAKNYQPDAFNIKYIGIVSTSPNLLTRTNSFKFATHYLSPTLRKPVSTTCIQSNLMMLLLLHFHSLLIQHVL